MLEEMRWDYRKNSTVQYNKNRKYDLLCNVSVLRYSGFAAFD
ncbi:hypothetical protein DORFOR_03071 [Dorea formicigenerans ATCC 27755]|uniref:Uncharacterized protein n=1 Tax=Dorea formicigenerans ATCC 27755 TaxID=411461 RepID=B0G9V5_9FIRM|nr:hypothetical protein DORFOR_03071 [Dorea formicigenerans ATCC 27755]